MLVGCDMGIIKKLESYKLLKAEALSLRQQYIDDMQMIEQLKKVNHPAYKRMQDDCNNTYERIETLINECKDIEKIIDKVPGNNGEFLRMYYIEGKSAEYIAEKLKYPVSSINQLKRSSIKWIDKHSDL